jgi:hypothetical protein
MEEIFIEGAPEIYFGGVAQYSPDDDGFYHGITGTVDNPVYRVGCYTDFRFNESVTVNEIRCDTRGRARVSRERDFLTATFTLRSLFPFSVLRHMINGGAVTWNDGENAEKMGIGTIDNSLYYLVFFSRVYDQTAGDFVSVTGHRCQFTGNFQMEAPYAGGWSISGIEIEFHADDTKPDDQKFATMIRVDEDVL